MSYAIARNLMVDGQVRPNKVTDARILAAMRTLPRERFVPSAAAPLAYADEDVPLGGGRFLMEPMAIARLVQAAALQGGESVLAAASGSGYGVALLAACGARVTAVEDDPVLLAIARAVLPEFVSAVTLVESSPAEGWPKGAPYDVVLIEGAVAEIPPSLVSQLKTEGRLVTVLRRSTGLGHAVVGERTAAGLGLRAVFDSATPLLPALRPAPGFVF